MKNSPIVWMNGELMRADAVRVSPFDLGLALGLGVFETMVAYDAQIFSWNCHFQRLEESARKLTLNVPDHDVVRDAIFQVLEANHLSTGRARVRLSVSGGENPFIGGAAPGNVIIAAMPQSKPADIAKVVVSPYRCNESSAMAGIKSSSYGPNLIAYRHAHDLGADEAILLNTRGDLCEGTTSNLFLVHGDQVITPPLESGCLPGVTRAIVIELCQSLGIVVEERVLIKDDLDDADEIFLTSSAREVQAATLDMEALDCPSEVTARIAEAYTDLRLRETKREAKS